jgi:hypothetical protein
LGSRESDLFRGCLDSVFLRHAATYGELLATAFIFFFPPCVLSFSATAFVL